MPPWVADYIGIPYEPGASSAAACDCWGLFSLAYNAHSGRVLPPYGGPLWYSRRTPGAPIGAAALEYAEKFVPVAPGSECLFDGVLFRMTGFPIHVGMVVEPGIMLHVQRGADSVIERYRDSMMWRHRIAGIYRHV